MSRIFDGDVYIRLRCSNPVLPAGVDADLILAHDGQLMPVTRVLDAEDWAEQLRTPAAFAMSLHTDLEEAIRCWQSVPSG